jgi:hypothetical protein
MYKYTNPDLFLTDFKNGKIEFPYKRLYYTDKQIKEMFNGLNKVKFDDRVFDKYYNIHNVKINTNNLLFLNQPRILFSKNSDYHNFSMISDMFQEKNRMLCKFFSASSSPLDYYNNNTTKLAMDTIKNNKIITPHNLREELYRSVKECSSFKSLNMIYLVKLFNVKSVLDPSSGWGDRLIAAMACNIRYVGVDPNTLLHPIYKEMLKFFIPKTKYKNYTMIEGRIQDVSLPNEKFDMVLTSPPYFKIEKYSNKGEVRDNNEHEWFKNFMIPMINKTYAKLNNNGKLVLIINQLPNENYIKKMINYIYDNISDLHYLGVIGYSDQKLKNPQPMWIWQKSKDIPMELYNPFIIISNHNIEINQKKINFVVFRDDYLIGGTKQRALVDLINHIRKNNKNITKFIYAGPSTGYAQVALAYCCKLTKTKAILFLGKPNYKNSKGNSDDNRTNLTKYALSQNSTELHEIENGYLKNLTKEADLYYKENKHNSYLLSFGGHEKIYMEFLERNIRKSIPKNMIKPKRLWIVSGSATILNVLYKIFPKTYFLVVQVGRTIWDDLIDKSRTTLYISEENFNDEAREQPPYDTVATYDAKLWVFFLKHGKNGDHIWNVGKDIKNI